MSLDSSTAAERHSFFDFDALGRHLCGEEEVEPEEVTRWRRGRHQVQSPDAAEADDGAIPGLDDLLAGLDEAAIRDLASRAVERGIPVSDIAGVERLEPLIQRLDALERMTFSQLRAEYESRGFVTSDGLMSRTELLPYVREVLIWEEMNTSGLMKVCQERNIHSDLAGLPHRLLLQLLAAPTWAVYGIPRQRFKDASTAEKVLNGVRSLETCGRQDLVVLSRENGLPIGNLADSDLVAQLRKAFVWQHLPEEELEKELQILGLELPKKEFAEERGLSLQEAALRRLKSTFWGVWGPQLECMELSEVFMRQFEMYDGMSSCNLQVAYSRLGLHLHPQMKDSEFLQELKQSFIWKHSSLEQLRAACAARGLPIEDEEVTDSLEYRLLRHDCVAHWHKRELAPRATTDHDTAVQIMEQWKAIDNWSMADLRTWYKEMGLPEEHGVDRDHIQSLARKISTWQTLSLAELEKEAALLQVQPSDSEPEADEESRKQAFVDALTMRDRMDVWDAKGFQASRIKAYQTSRQFVELYESYHDQPTEDLQKLARDAGLPHEVLDRSTILETLRTFLFWELAPLEELRIDCRDRGLPLETSGKDEDTRQELYQRLRVDLSVQLGRTTYVQKGIPVERLQSLAADSVLRQYQSIENQSDEDLRKWYAGSFPEEACIQREELVQVAKQVSLWHEMETEELRRECEKKKVQLKEPREGDDRTEKTRMVDALVDNDRMETWEARGYRAKAIDNIEKVTQMVIQCETWQTMGHGGLKKALSDSGYTGQKGAGHEVLASLDQLQLFKALKAAYVWELLPLTALVQECKERLPQLPDGLGRPERIRWLLRATFANTWAPRGIPAERLGSLEVAEEVIQEYDALQASVLYHEMIGEGLKPLEEAYKKWKLPFDSKLDSQALLDRWRDLLVWNRLPVVELQRECRAHGVSPDAPGLQPKAPSSLSPPSTFHNPPGALQGGRKNLQAGSLGGKGKSTGGLGLPPSLSKNFGKGVNASQRGPLGKLPAPSLLGKLDASQLGKSVKANEALERMAQTKEAKEQEEQGRRILIERLVLATWRSSWKPRGIPADRLDSIETVMSIVKEIDRISDLPREGLEEECNRQGIVFNKNCDRATVEGRLRMVILWQHMPEAELRREFRTQLKRDNSQDIDRAEMMEQLLAHSILRESEAQGVPVLAIPDHMAAFRLIEGIDQSDFSSLKEFYENELNMPSESCMTRAELVKLIKLLHCWQELPMEELCKECAKYGVKTEGSPAHDSRTSLADELLFAERRQVWDTRGYQATRIVDINQLCNLISTYESYKAKGDEEISEVFKKMSIPTNELSQEEKLRTTKLVLVWEFLPLEEVKKECASRKIPYAQTVASWEGDQQELLNELVYLLKVDLRVRMSKDALEQRGIPVSRLGSRGAALADEHLSALEARTTEELRTEYGSMGLSTDEPGLDRQHMLDILKTRVVWQLLPLSELQRECLDRDVPLHVETSATDEAEENEEDGRPSPKRDELFHRLTIDLHVSENRSLYFQRGVPIGRLGSQKAYAVLMKFEEYDAFDIDTIRNTQKDFGLPPAPTMTKEELLSRLKDVTIWRQFSVEELEKECRIRVIAPPKSVSSGGQMRSMRREVLLDVLILHRCARTYDEVGVPYKLLQTAKAANTVLQAWDDLLAMPPQELLFRYKALGLSSNLLEVKEVMERLKNVAVYLEVPLEDLQSLCAARQVVPGNDTRRDLVRRLAQALWPPKVEPPKPKPKPRSPPPQPKPPPPRIPVVTTRMRLASYFQVLQLPPTAGIDEVKKAYRRLALKHHPDKNRGERDEKAANETFQKVAEAYEKLSEHFLDKGK